MTPLAEQVEVRWLPGLASAPGAVDLRTVGPMGPVAKAVTLPEALTMGLVIDLLCPASDWHRTISSIAAQSTDRRQVQ